MKKLLIIAAAAMTVGSAAMAESYQCNRVSLSSHGFVDRAAAESWFPKNLWLNTNGYKAQSNYGTAFQEDGRWILFRTGNNVVRMELRGNTIYVSLGSKSGFKQTAPSKYQCSTRSTRDYNTTKPRDRYNIN